MLEQAARLRQTMQRLARVKHLRDRMLELRLDHFTHRPGVG
jgi:hypothetical protein